MILIMFGLGHQIDQIVVGVVVKGASHFVCLGLVCLFMGFIILK
jgi:hypothetical protein